MEEKKYAIYVHIPFCKSRCHYCDFSSCIDFDLCEKYFDKLFLEIENSKIYCKKISTIFWGGGTPSSVPTVYLDRIFDKLSSKFDLSDVTEITVECNPESVTEKLVDCLISNKVNRVSLGLQSANDATLKKIGRIHNYSQFLSALSLFNSRGINNINADLIIGLPEDMSSFSNTLNKVVELPLTHLSCYALELHENTKLFAQKQFCVTDGDLLADMYDLAVKTFEEHMFMRYEVSNFAKPGFECKHNLTYWTQNHYYGFGASAAGFVESTRYTNIFDIKSYIDSNNVVSESCVLTDFDKTNEYAMLGLRLTRGVNKQKFKDLFGLDFYSFFDSAKQLVDGGFLIDDGSSVYVAPSKMYILNSILCKLLR